MMKYCNNCGNPLVLKEDNHNQYAYCPICDRSQYEQLKVGAGAIIELDNKLLLIQRTQSPFFGCWNLPAGYVEVDESPIDAVIREVKEEVGLQVEVTDLENIYFFKDDPRGNGILIVYQCIALGGILGESVEGKYPNYFTYKDIPKQLAGGGHNQGILAWQKLRS